MSYWSLRLFYVFCILVGALCLVPTAAGQDASTATLEGTVTDTTGTPLAGANVRIGGTQLGASADADGMYRITGIEPGERTVVASFLGYETVRRTVTLDAGETRTLNLTLGASTVGLDEMVVTALGIDREERSLGYAVSDVSGSDLAETREVNVMNSLAGKVAGLNIVGGSAGLASTPRVTIRGESSLAGTNRPLIVVDGVPIDNTPNTQFADAQFTQVDYGDGLDQINPQNIAEMSVLKGPSAAALYGARAANGVILIETKDGEGTDGIGVTFNTNVTTSRILKLPDYQNEYSAGAGGEYKFVNGDGTGGGRDGQGYNWGLPLDEGIERTQFGSPRDENGNLIPMPMESNPNNVRNFFEMGTNVTTDVAVRGGNEDGSFRASLSRMDRTGVVPNTELRRNNVTVSASYNVTDALTVDANANYAKTTSDNLPTSGYGSESIMYSFTWWGRHLQTDWLKDYWMEGQEGTQQRNFDMNWTNNIYFQVNENTNSLDKDRLFGNVTARYAFSDNLNLRARTGLDYRNQSTKMRKAFSTITATNGWLQENEQKFLEWNSNLLLRYTLELGDSFTIRPSIGSNFMRQSRRNIGLTAPALSVPDVYNIGNSRTNVQAQERDAAKEILSVYGTGTINYEDLLFLDLTARNDWSSTLPTDNNSYFYPSASLSLIASDLFEVPESVPLSFAKLRLSWAQVGNDTEPYRLRNTYNYGDAWGGTQTVISPADVANPDLKPEIVTSYEAGTDLRFFDSRVQLDVTYYRSSARNQILRVPLTSSTGFDSRLVNAGEIRNTGVEAGVQLTPIANYAGLSWDVSFNWSRNRSTVVELAEGITTYQLASPYGGSVEARVGGRMGDMYGRVFERVEDPDSPHTGEIIYEDGLPQLTNEVQKIGNYHHDWQGGVGTTLSYQNVRLSATVDVRQGGRIYSYTRATGLEGGTLEGSTCCRGETVVGDGVVRNEDGTYSENTEEAQYTEWLRNYYARSNIEANSFDASYVKLRELRLSYSFTPSWLEQTGLQNASVSLVGRNLFLWTDVPHIDPETTFKNGESRTPGFEVQQLPSTRSIGMDLQLNF